MSAVLPILLGWGRDAQRLAGAFPGLAARLEPGSWPLATIIGLGGVALLAAGLRLDRVVACAGGAFLGWGIGRCLPVVAAGVVPAGLWPWACAVPLAAAGVFAPDTFPVALAMTPGVVLGWHVPIAGHAWLGAVAGGVVLGLLGVALRRVLLAAAGAAGGAALVVLAVLATSRQVAIFGILAHRPVLLAALAGVLTVAGAAFQLGSAGKGGGGRKGKRAPPPEPVEET